VAVTDYEPPMPLGSSRLGAALSRRQVALIPGDPELAVALRALHVDGVARDRRAGAAHGADRVARAPMIREVWGVRGARHDGPMAGAGEERLQEAPRDPDSLAPWDLEDRILRREAHDAVPGAAPQAAVLVDLEAGPGPRQGLSGWLHVCNLKGQAEAVNQ